MASMTTGERMAAIRVAGWHARPGDMIRLLQGIGPHDRTLARRAYSEGVQARESRMPCGCADCCSKPRAA